MKKSIIFWLFILVAWPCLAALVPIYQNPYTTNPPGTVLGTVLSSNFQGSVSGGTVGKFYDAAGVQQFGILNGYGTGSLSNINVTGQTVTNQSVFTATGNKFQDSAGQIYVTGGSHIGALFKSSGGTIYWATNSDGSANEAQWFNPGFGFSQDNTGYEWLHSGGSVSLDTHAENSFAGTNMYPYPASKTALVDMGDSITASTGRPSYPYVLRTNYSYYANLLLFTNQAVAGDTFSGQTNKFWTSTYPMLQALGLDNPTGGTNVIITMMIGRNDLTSDYATYIANYSNFVSQVHVHGWLFMGITILPTTTWLGTSTEAARWKVNQAILFNGTAPTIDVVDGTDYLGATNGIPCDFVMDAAKVLPDCTDSATNTTHYPTYAPDGTHPMAYSHRLLAKEFDRALRYHTQRWQEPVERVGYYYDFKNATDGSSLVRLSTNGEWLPGIRGGPFFIHANGAIGGVFQSDTNNTQPALQAFGSQLMTSQQIFGVYGVSSSSNLTQMMAVNADSTMDLPTGKIRSDGIIVLHKTSGGLNMFNMTNSAAGQNGQIGVSDSGAIIFGFGNSANETNWMSLYNDGHVGVGNQTVTNTLTANVAVNTPQYLTTEINISSSNIDASTGGTFWKQLAANTPFLIQNLGTGANPITVNVSNSASFVATWSSGGFPIKWPGGTPPTLTTGGHSDVFTFVPSHGFIYGSVVTNF